LSLKESVFFYYDYGSESADLKQKALGNTEWIRMDQRL